MDLKVDLKSISILGLIIALTLGVINAQAQTNIVRAEYFINEDPGFGLAIPINIGAGTSPSFDVNFNAATDTLSEGYHFIYIRSQDEIGVWSYLEVRSFYVIEPSAVVALVTPKIIGIEYFINEDPGQGLAIYFNVTDDFTIDIPSLLVQTDTLSTGYHIIGTRAKTEYGHWGWYERRSFYVTTTGAIVVPPVQKIVDVEYYFDNDPGQGLATSLGPYSTNLTFDLNELIPTSLTPGYHTFNVRSQNENGHWGFVEQRPVYVITAGSTTSITDINKIEYFIDGVDPGVGDATNIPITPGQVIEMNTVDIPTSPSLIDGEHYITFRARNGNGWGLAEIDTFDILDDCTQPVAGFTPQLNCAGKLVTFVDISTDIQSDAVYNWDFNGDGNYDDFTVGDASFTYVIAGTYAVELKITQGTICLNTFTTNITIKPQPVAVFSGTGTTVNQPTNFTASTNNLPVGAIWEWDFDGDLTVDDSTVGATSFTYTTEATFNPILTITDGFGCDVTVTNPIIIATSGGGGSSPPLADFLPENGCVGNAISFVDLSQNIPQNSTYSWDFDGDGFEDASTIGTASFIYPSSGIFSAKLSINTGSKIVENTQLIEVEKLPIPDFFTIEVCEGSIVDFTNMSTDAIPTAVYMWDFDNDGIVDSNAKTGITFTYDNQGSHIVKLTISNGFGCMQEIVKQVSVVGLPTPDFAWDIICTGDLISFDNLSTQIATNATYSWDLDGDGNEDFTTVGDVEFTYPIKGMYDASLTITNAIGCATSITKMIEIVDRPQVALDVIAKCYGQPSQMIDLSQDVSPTATYAWDFDNDNTVDDSTVGTTEFTYAAYNSYVVNLRISNGGGCSSSAEKLVVFSDAATPDFTINKTCQGEEVVFTDLSINLETGAIYSWDFDGDGSEDGATPGSTINTFGEAGIYNATLTIDNGGQCLAFKTMELDVTPPPSVDLGANLELCNEGVVTFDAGTGYSTYLWPDGSTEQTFTVDKVGDYMVKVQDAKGCFNTDTILVNLLGPPIPTFEHFIELSLEGIKVHFTNSSTNGDSFTWSFGDGATSDEADPVHIYSDFSFYETSVYEVCITSTNACEQAQYCESIFVSPTAFLEESGESINVYPNPLNRIVTVETGLEVNNTSRIGLVNSQGQLIWSRNKRESKYEINMEHHPNGVYFFVARQKDKLLFKRIIKQ